MDLAGAGIWDTMKYESFLGTYANIFMIMMIVFFFFKITRDIYNISPQVTFFLNLPRVCLFRELYFLH